MSGRFDRGSHNVTVAGACPRNWRRPHRARARQRPEPLAVDAGVGAVAPVASGRLAEFDGEEWTVLERDPFMEAAGRKNFGEGVFATGWDGTSAIPKLYAEGDWRTYRLPKGSRTFDHGWQTEGTRIREVETERYLSGLWFGKPDDLWTWGKPQGFGAVWDDDSVEAGEASVPFLMTGYDDNCLHLAHGRDEAVAFDVEVDFRGDDTWHTYETVRVPARGYGDHAFPRGPRSSGSPPPATGSTRSRTIRRSPRSLDSVRPPATVPTDADRRGRRSGLRSRSARVVRRNCDVARAAKLSSR